MYVGTDDNQICVDVCCETGDLRVRPAFHNVCHELSRVATRELGHAFLYVST